MDITNFPYEIYNKDNNFILTHARLIEILLTQREDDVVDALEQCTCHNLCKCIYDCHCRIDYINNPKCPFVQHKEYLKHWDEITYYIRNKMCDYFRQYYPNFPQKNCYNYYWTCNTFSKLIIGKFDGIKKYIHFREICERFYYQMAIRVVNRLNIPMAKYSLDTDLSWNNYLNKLHISQCEYNKICKSKSNNSKEKAFYNKLEDTNIS